MLPAVMLVALFVPPLTIFTAGAVKVRFLPAAAIVPTKSTDDTARISSTLSVAWLNIRLLFVPVTESAVKVTAFSAVPI